MAGKYRITPTFWLIRDEAGVKFHIESGDYFGTIATILRLLRENIKKDTRFQSAAFKKTLKNLENDLAFLQTNYRIEPKSQSKPRIKNKKMMPKGRLNSQ